MRRVVINYQGSSLFDDEFRGKLLDSCDGSPEVLQKTIS